MNLINTWLGLLGLLFFLTSKVLAQAGTSNGINDSTNISSSCDTSTIDDYNWPLHIGGLFIILVISSIGIYGSITLAVSKHHDNIYIVRTLKVLKFFGTGVILSTAYIHMLADSYSNFLNPCITNDIWVSYQANWPGLFAMIGGLVIQFLEFIAIRKQDKAHLKHHNINDERKNISIDKESQESKSLNEEQIQVHAHPHPHSHPNHEPSKQGKETLADVSGDHHGHFDLSGINENSPDINMLKIISTITLEIGIIFHSIIIGITLAITTDSFSSLLTALIFHQFFEGIALGTRIAETHLPLIRQLIMGTFYPLTTPFGIAIGFGLKNILEPLSQNSLIIQGIFDGLSAGLLLYSVYVSLISMDMNHNVYFRTKESPFMRRLCLGSFIFGIIMMSVVGIWA